MELPNVDNFVNDESRNIRVNVKAYRKLSEAEAMQAIHQYRATADGRKSFKDNISIKIISLIGLND